MVDKHSGVNTKKQAEWETRGGMSRFPRPRKSRPSRQAGGGARATRAIRNTHFHGAGLISSANGWSSCSTTFASPTAITVEGAAAKYFFAAALTSAALDFSSFSL